MLQNLRNRASDESGFTLIELLVVILIIGILAAIALPTFLGQRTKAQDSSAKSNARNAVSQLESFYTEGDTYANFSVADSGLDPAEVAVTGNNADGYTITATSKSKNTFLITKVAAGTSTRSCTTTGGGTTKGGCRGTSW